ncbi:MAG: DNA primase [Lachnospiraceae bacterium]|nr:DNA primase [Lachnospiraceae bacterium]
MAFFKNEVIEEVRSRNDIVDVIGSYVQLKKKGSRYVGLCPFHNEKTGSFMVNRDFQTYKCFGCGKRGNVFTFVMEYESYSFPEAVKFLAERAGIVLEERDETEGEKRSREEKAKLLEVNKEAATFFYYLLRDEQGKSAYEYFRGRGLSDETINRFGLGFGGNYSSSLYKHLKSKGYKDDFLKNTGLVYIEERGSYDRFWKRAIFPIMDAGGKVIGFGGRVMGEAGNSPKYLNSPDTKVFDKGRNLYALWLAKRTKRDYFLLCEGYMDVISLHAAGYDNAVASLGTALTPHQARLISRYVKNVVITYDSDGAGQNAALRAIPILRDCGLGVKVLNMSPYKDPDEFIKALGAEEYEKRIESAQNSFFFEAEAGYEGKDMNDPDVRAQFAARLAQMLAKIEDELTRDSYIKAVSGRYGIDAAMLTRSTNKIGYDMMVSESQKTAREEERRKRELVRADARLEAEEAERESAAQGVASSEAQGPESAGEAGMARTEGAVASDTRPKPADRAKARAAEARTEGLRRAETLLLTILARNPKLYERIGGIITPESFLSGQLAKKVAAISFDQLANEGQISPARVISNFEDAERQGFAAGMFTPADEDLPEDKDLKRAFADVVIKIREEEIAERQAKAGAEKDAQELMRLMKEKAELPNLKRSLMK